MDVFFTTAFPLVAYYYTTTLDATDASTLLAVRVAYAFILALDFYALYSIRNSILRKSDTTLLVYWPKNKQKKPKKGAVHSDDDGGMTGDPDDAVITTNRDFDLKTWRTMALSHVVGAAISMLLHYWGALAPLTVAAASAVPQLLDNPLFKLHVLRKPAVGALVRPFGEPATMWTVVGKQYQDLRREMATASR